MAQVVGDTNVFYNLGSGERALADVIKPGDTLHYTPIAVLEITSKLAPQTFEERKAAAQAIIDSGETPLFDPESHLTLLFGNELSEDPFDVTPAVVAISQSTDLTALQAGVPDYFDRVVRKVSVDAAGHWRTVTDTQWRDDMIAVMEDVIPRFRGWYNPDPAQRAGAKPRLTGDRKSEFFANTQSEEWLTTLIKACQDRSFHKAKRTEGWEPTAEFVEKLVAAQRGIACYVAIYTHYLIKLLTEDMMPQLNDSGDLELFLYATDDDHIIATSEKRWLDIATRAGYVQRVRKI